MLNIDKIGKNRKNGQKDYFSFFSQCLFKLHFVVKAHDRLWFGEVFFEGDKLAFTIYQRLETVRALQTRNIILRV